MTRESVYTIAIDGIKVFVPELALIRAIRWQLLQQVLDGVYARIFLLDDVDATLPLANPTR